MCPQTLEPIEEEDTSKRRKRKGKSQRSNAIHVENNDVSKDDKTGSTENMVVSSKLSTEMIVQDYFPDETLNANTPIKSAQTRVNLHSNKKIFGSSPPFCPPDVLPTCTSFTVDSP